MTKAEILRQYLAFQTENPLRGRPEELFEPANYMMNLGGKRIRPLLCLLGYGLFRSDHHQAFKLAHAIEVFHNFTLIHDDIIDNAPLRRGQQTVHEKWDVNQGILSGDAMLVRAFAHINSINANDDLIRRIIGLFSQMAEDVCRGQQLDVNFETQLKVTIPDYLEMIQLKTSVLLGFSLQAGGLLAGCSENDGEALYQYGLNTGMAFQIMDDKLDAFGGEEVGKQIGGDIIENKKTLLLIELQNRADQADLAIIKQLMSDKDKSSADKVEAFIRLYKKYKIEDFVDGQMNAYFIRAEQILAKLESPNSKESLSEITDGLRIRIQ